MKSYKLNQFPITHPHEINISHSPITNIQQLNHPAPQFVNRLTVIHCSLYSLKGIQHYTGLVALNIKFNNLDNPEQILLIPNKDKIYQLNLQGNKIEYYSLCTFVSLHNYGFTTLKLFNNRDYSKWTTRIHNPNHHNKRLPTKKLTKKLTQYQYSMTKTLKRAIRTNVIDKYRLIPDIYQESSVPDTDHDHDIENVNSNLEKNNCKKQFGSGRYNNQKLKCTSLWKGRDESLGERTPLKEISLSNANIVKSVKPEFCDKYQQKTKNGYQLAIQPIQFNQNQISHLPITQPTATFASQRQKDSKAFRSRNHCKSIINGVLQDQLQYLPNQNQYQQLSQIIPNSQRPSLSIIRSQAYENKSFFVEDLHDNVQDKMYSLAIMVHLKGLLGKGFRALKPKNMPKKVREF